MASLRLSDRDNYKHRVTTITFYAEISIILINNITQYNARTTNLKQFCLISPKSAKCYEFLDDTWTQSNTQFSEWFKWPYSIGRPLVDDSFSCSQLAVLLHVLRYTRRRMFDGIFRFCVDRLWNAMWNSKMSFAPVFSFGNFDQKYIFALQRTLRSCKELFNFK